MIDTTDIDTINLMPDLRETARNHPDFTVDDDGSVTLKEGVTASVLHAGSGGGSNNE